MSSPLPRSVGACACLAALSFPALAHATVRPPDEIEREETPAPQQTERELEESDREDSGRGLEFVWLVGEVGFQNVGLSTFEANDLVDANVTKTQQSGLVYGGGLGLRLVFLTLGARFRLGSFDQWQLWTLNGEVGLRIPLGKVEPYFTLGGGYASLGSFDSSQLGGGLQAQDVEITGYDLRGGFGVDLYLSNVVTIGGLVTGDVLGLTRPGVDPSKLQAAAGGGTAQSTADVYAADGSSVGAGFAATFVLGLHL
ncbi:MAG: hypothetical protein IT376_14940 [Polyangiaceae bacterium]|nr:hypothetical protein [Polyangiaceae bacterium]